MFSRGNHGLVVVLAAIGVFQGAEAHPGCAPDTTTLTKGVDTIFCPTDVDPLYDDGICCDAGMEAEILLKIDAADLPVGSRCAEMYQEVRGKQKSQLRSPAVVGNL